ncbi:hypothetical protein BJ508DRAFT_312552 [Ascobolus immersus RN42]|uniref:Uncharacterized protein n=1 Tax=Ascobolus immersus RN42 TaxID=1160509 RepID=A0A3N4HLR5_ASCIM|nr:hypothetical protein BJ508DRAFT_312552 [Ascobolus immersus RN42]
MYRIADKYGIPYLAKYVAKQQGVLLNHYYKASVASVGADEIWCIKRAYKFFKEEHDPMRLFQIKNNTKVRLNRKCNLAVGLGMLEGCLEVASKKKDNGNSSIVNTLSKIDLGLEEKEGCHL